MRIKYVPVSEVVLTQIKKKLLTPWFFVEVGRQVGPYKPVTVNSTP